MYKVRFLYHEEPTEASLTHMRKWTVPLNTAVGGSWVILLVIHPTPTQYNMWLFDLHVLLSAQSLSGSSSNSMAQGPVLLMSMATR